MTSRKRTRGPLGLHDRFCGAGDLADGESPVGDLDESRSRVGGVRDAAYVAGAFELVDEVSSGLLGDAGSLGEVGHAGAGRADPGGHPALGDAQIREPGPSWT